jgi:diguanylate cyclase (GGDEF)-like protein/PAS domain S-box-containing protein
MTDQRTSAYDALADAVLQLHAGSLYPLNENARRMFGIASHELSIATCDALLEGHGLREWLFGSGELHRERLQGVRRDGVPFTIDLSARRTADGDGAICVMREVSSTRESGEAQRYFDAAFDVAPIGMALFNTDGEYTRVNTAMCELLRRTPEELLGCRDQEITHPDDREADLEAAERILKGEIDCWQTEKRFVRPDGSTVWAVANMTFLRDDDGCPLAWMGQFQDITDRETAHSEMRALADSDSLTGLANRRGFERELAGMLERGHDGAVVIVDLDRFKAVNDSHGHGAGDQVLIGVAGAIRDSLRDGDLAARLGGDEFALVLPSLHREGAESRALLLAEKLGRLEFDFSARPGVPASIGIAEFAGVAESPAAIIGEADAAMYEAKRASRSRPAHRSGFSVG